MAPTQLPPTIDLYDASAINSTLTSALIAAGTGNKTLNVYFINVPPQAQTSSAFDSDTIPGIGDSTGQNGRDYLHEAMGRMLSANIVIMPNGDEYISNGDIQSGDGTLEFIDGETGQKTVLAPTKLDSDQSWLEYFKDMGYEGIRLAAVAVPAAVVAVVIDKISGEDSLAI